MVNATNFVSNRFPYLISICILAIACSGGGDSGKSSMSPPAPTSHCTAVGATCDMASDPCCYSNGAQTQCKSGTCQVCADTNASCSADSDCCPGHTCSSDTCLLNVGNGPCKQNSDCCCNPSVVSCIGTGCCLNSGTEISCGSSAYNICCSGSGYSVDYTNASTYTLCYFT